MDGFVRDGIVMDVIVSDGELQPIDRPLEDPEYAALLPEEIRQCKWCYNSPSVLLYVRYSGPEAFLVKTHLYCECVDCEQMASDNSRADQVRLVRKYLRDRTEYIAQRVKETNDMASRLGVDMRRQRRSKGKK